MRCLLCGNRTDTVTHVTKKIPIFECKSCSFGFIDQSKTIHFKPDTLYSFSEYDKHSQIHKQRLLPFVKKVTDIIPSGNVLEIGSGFGLFSSILLDRGSYRLTVIEPSLKPFYLKNRNVSIFKTDLNGFLRKNNKDKFRIIILMDVIEHLDDPQSALKHLQKLLLQNGIIVIQTPNYKSIMRKVTRNWSWWMIEDHKWFFSLRSLSQILNKTGYEKVYYRTYEDWIDFKKNLDGNFLSIKNLFLRKIYKFMFFSFFFPFYFVFRNLIWNFGFGGLIFSIYKKKYSD